MREIKFRAWDTRLKVMYSQEDLEADNRALGSHGIIVAMDADSAKSGHLWNCDWLEPLLYTGLKDKNGVEIYEGDIVKQYQTSRGHVYAKQNLRVIKWVNAAHNTGFNIAERGTHRTEVIGNIYEDPELLEQK